MYSISLSIAALGGHWDTERLLLPLLFKLIVRETSLSEPEELPLELPPPPLPDPPAPPAEQVKNKNDKIIAIIMKLRKTWGGKSVSKLFFYNFS